MGSPSCMTNSNISKELISFIFLFRFSNLPLALIVMIELLLSRTEIPDESYPRYSSFESPVKIGLITGLLEKIPKIPHIIFFNFF